MRAVLSCADHGPRPALRVLRVLAVWVAVVGGIEGARPSLAEGQVFVLPRRPSQTNVRYADFDWRYADILVGERIEHQLEWPEGPRFHAGAFRLPGLGTPWSYPNATQAPLTYQRASSDETPSEARERARERAERQRAARITHTRKPQQPQEYRFQPHQPSHGFAANALANEKPHRRDQGYSRGRSGQSLEVTFVRHMRLGIEPRQSQRSAGDEDKGRQPAQLSGQRTGTPKARERPIEGQKSGGEAEGNQVRKAVVLHAEIGFRVG
jgi:hypothetical protein